MNFEDKKVLVVGAGKSGIAACNLLCQKKTNTILYDANVNLDVSKLKEQLNQEFHGEILLGELTDEIVEHLDYVILSPGVPTDLPYVNRLRDLGIPILGEIELAYQFAKGKVAAITGTNGKTTTTTLVGEIMKTYYDHVFVVGNIGVPYTQMAELTTNDSVTVAEMSSFQLETVLTFRPNVSAILNLTPDHLNRHHTMEAYVDAKLRITMHQTASDYCVLNYEDPLLRKAAENITTNIVWFSSAHRLEKGLYLHNDEILYHDGNEEVLMIKTEELQILGRHNYENVMAAVAIAICMNVPYDCIRTALREFKGVEHRIEYVTEKFGVKYYNDSKGTNPDAAIQGIRAMKTKTLLIAGGYDKNSEYDEWIRAFDHKVTYLVLLGQTREKIKEAAHRLGVENIILVDSLQDAVEFCALHAKPGESVLLSPCCASWGMFKDYEERGRMFKEYVYAIEE